MTDGKTRVTMRIDTDVVNDAKKEAKKRSVKAGHKVGYQTVLNERLRTATFGLLKDVPTKNDWEGFIKCTNWFSKKTTLE